MARRWLVHENSRLIRSVMADIVNTGEFGRVPELFTADYTLHKTGLSVPGGPEAFKMAVRQWRDAFPDYRVTVAALVEQDDLVACRFVAEGTHRGALLGVPPTGKAFTVHGTDLHRVAGGRVAESWLADDIPRVLADVGFLQPSTSSGWT
jgi:predicted ester cyclase